MLNVTQIMDKLHAAPEEFMRLMEEGRFCQAKWLYYRCIVTAVFIELDDTAMERLFGTEGAFKEELVKKVYREAGGGE